MDFPEGLIGEGPPEMDFSEGLIGEGPPEMDFPEGLIGEGPPERPPEMDLAKGSIGEGPPEMGCYDQQQVVAKQATTIPCYTKIQPNRQKHKQGLKQAICETYQMRCVTFLLGDTHLLTVRGVGGGRLFGRQEPLQWRPCWN